MLLSGNDVPNIIIVQILLNERATASGVTDAPFTLATARRQGIPRGTSGRQRSRGEIRLGRRNVGTMRGKGVEVVEMMERRQLEVLCIQKTKWKGDRARTMMEGYKLLHAGGDGISNSVGIIVSEEVARNGLAVASSFFLPEAREPKDHIQEWTAQDRIRSTDSPEAATMED